MHQLDIFADSRDRVLVNRLAEALCAADLQQAHIAGAALAAEYPADRHLPSAATLIDALALESQHAAMALPRAADAQSAQDHLLHTLTPAALLVLGADAAKPWLEQRWQALARRAAALPFDPQMTDCHASALWLRGRCWAEAERAATAIESWRRKPTPLAWVAQARWHLQGPDAAWPLLAEVAWLAPQRLPAVLSELPDPALHKWARQFEDSALADDESGLDWRWWPAWLLVEQPLLDAPLQAAVTDGVQQPEAGFKLLQALLRAERQGRQHEGVALRRQLQALQPALFRAYMATR